MNPTQPAKQPVPSRGQILRTKIKRLNAEDEEDRLKAEDLVRHLLWIAFEARDEATLTDAQTGLNPAELERFEEILTESCLEPIVIAGQRRFQAQVVAFPIILRLGERTPIPVTMESADLFAQHVRRIQEGWGHRGLALQKRLLSIAELQDLSPIDAYHFANQVIRGAVESAQEMTARPKREELEHYGLSLGSEVTILRFLLGVTFGQTSSELVVPQGHRHHLNQLATMLLTSAPNLPVVATMATPARLDQAAMNAVPAMAGAVYGALIDHFPRDADAAPSIVMDTSCDQMLLGITTPDDGITAIPFRLDGFPLEVTAESIGAATEACRQRGWPIPIISYSDTGSGNTSTIQ